MKKLSWPRQHITFFIYIILDIGRSKSKGIYCQHLHSPLLHCWLHTSWPLYLLSIELHYFLSHCFTKIFEKNKVQYTSHIICDKDFSLSLCTTMSSKSANGYAINNIQSSPPTSPRNRQNCRRRLRRRGSFAMLHRRHFLLLVSVLYFTGLISCVGPLFSLLQYSGFGAGAIYRSHEIFQKLWTDIEADNSSSIEVFFLLASG